MDPCYPSYRLTMNKPLMEGHEDLNGAWSAANWLFFGCFVGTTILGITIVQAWNYFRHNKDSWMMQAFVATMVGLDIIESFSTILALRGYLTTHFGDHKCLRTFHPLISLSFLTTAITFTQTHLFLARRIYYVCRRKWLFAVNVSLSLVVLSFGLVSSVSRWLPASFQARSGTRYTIAIVHFICVVLDIIVTVTLTTALVDIQLSAKKFITGSTSELLHRVLVFTVTRGIVMTVAQVAHITMFLVRPKEILFWASSHFFISKLYVLTTLVTLNSRRYSNKVDEFNLLPVDDEAESMRFANRDSIDEEESQKPRAVQSAPAFV